MEVFFPSAMPKAFRDEGSTPGRRLPSLRSAAIIEDGEPSRFAEPASAAYSRLLEKAKTTRDASKPNTISKTKTVSMYIPPPRRFFPEPDRIDASTREKKMTNALRTPCTRASVTMSPFATWLISCPSTALSSSRVICPMMSVDTATSAWFLNAPVANAFAAPGYIATSGVLMLARMARFSTVVTSHLSASPSLPSITFARQANFAIGLERSSEIKAPMMP